MAQNCSLKHKIVMETVRCIHPIDQNNLMNTQVTVTPGSSRSAGVMILHKVVEN